MLTLVTSEWVPVTFSVQASTRLSWYYDQNTMNNDFGFRRPASWTAICVLYLSLAKTSHSLLCNKFPMNFSFSTYLLTDLCFLLCASWIVFYLRRLVGRILYLYFCCQLPSPLTQFRFKPACFVDIERPCHCFFIQTVFLGIPLITWELRNIRFSIKIITFLVELIWFCTWSVCL